MAGDWRVTVTLPQRADAEAFMEWLGVNLPEGDVTRDGSRIHVYADDPRGVKHVEHVVATMCDELETPAYVVVDRWNPGRDEWQPPGITVDAVEEPVPSAYDLDFETLHHEVVASSPNRLDSELVDRLRRELRVFPLGPHRLWAAAPTAEEVQEVVDRLRVELSPETQFEVEPLTRRRRWLRQQQLLGNYASGGGS
jgi:hypothetical protein